MIVTDIGLQICRIVVVDLKGIVLFDRWFGVKEGTGVLDFVTHITGIDGDVYKEKMLGTEAYGEKWRDVLMELVKDKVIVGHDLVNDLKMLLIKHQAFIDSVWLMPHHFGLPLKNKLKDLAFEYLKKYIQWGSHDPY